MVIPKQAAMLCAPLPIQFPKGTVNNLKEALLYLVKP